MKVNSISGVTCYVEDPSETAEFYEALGFRRGKAEPGRVTFYVNWFFVTFVAQETELPNKGSGLFLYIKVDDVEDFHKGVLSKGMKPEGEPEIGPSGNREFVLRDPMATGSPSFRRSKERGLTRPAGPPSKGDDKWQRESL